MPWTAIDEDGKKYDATEMTVDEMKALRSVPLFCSCKCGAAMRIRAIQSKYYDGHFYKTGDGPREHIGAPETPEHREAKKYVKSILKQDYPNCRVEMEYSFYLADGVTRRQSDLMLFDADGEMFEVHEVQFSGQGIDEYERRTREYNEMGLEVGWWVDDKKSQNLSLRDFSYRTGTKIFTLRSEYSIDSMARSV